MFLYNEFQFIFVYFNICFVMLLLVASYVCAVYAPDNNKGVPYVCGFLGFSVSRELFNLQFYKIALLFLIVDLEIVILLPWCLAVHLLGWGAYISSIVFLLFLTFGFSFTYLFSLLGKWRKKY